MIIIIEIFCRRGTSYFIAQKISDEKNKVQERRKRVVGDSGLGANDRQ